MSALLLLYLIGGFLLIALSIPLLYNKIPPNAIYGFRLPQTVHKPDVWYAVNCYSARWLLMARVSVMVTAVLLHLVPG